MYSLYKCHFCNSSLYKGLCNNIKCSDEHMYYAIAENHREYGQISFKIDNYGFDYYTNGEMEICILKKSGIIKEVIKLSDWIYVDKNNYLEVMEKVNKLRMFS